MLTVIDMKFYGKIDTRSTDFCTYYSTNFEGAVSLLSLKLPPPRPISTTNGYDFQSFVKKFCSSSCKYYYVT